MSLGKPEEGKSNKGSKNIAEEKKDGYKEGKGFKGD
jgi:hypothetical protein